MGESEIREMFEALGRGEVDVMAGRMAADVVLEFPGLRFGGKLAGRRAVTVFLKQNQRLFRGGLRFDVEWAGVCGDRAVAQWRNKGVTRDGRPYANRGVTVFRLEGDVIVGIQDYLDTELIAATWPR